MKKYISKALLVLSLIFLLFGLISAIEVIDYMMFDSGLFRDAEKLNLILLFLSSGVCIGLYRIIDLLERK